jgi:hypothetical protein
MLSLKQVSRLYPKVFTVLFYSVFAPRKTVVLRFSEVTLPVIKKRKLIK